MKTPIAVYTSDWHLRLTPPPCFVGTDEEWITYQRDTMEHIYGICPTVYIAGDLFDVSRPSVRMLNLFLACALTHGRRTIFMEGNHEEGKGANYADTAFGTLLTVAHVLNDNLFLIKDNCAYLPPGSPEVEGVVNSQILFAHTGVTEEENVFYGQTATQFLEKYSRYSLVVCGDNHRSFMYTSSDGRTLLNPGCTTIQRIDMVDYKPSVFVQWTDGTITKELLPKSPMLSATPLEVEEDADFSVLINELRKDGTPMEFDVKTELKDRMAEIPLDKAVKAWIYKLFPKLIEE